ncbi:MAG: hypothetical protein C4525_13990 [Desulfarculus sp.]|nr:MAG: hypothetical protein C4525_13990 [Desulfarculus sp.]
MTLPFVFSLPHSSQEVPPEVRPDLALDQGQIFANLDLGAAEVFAELPGLALLPADYSRLVVDLNRNAVNHGAKGVVALTDYTGRAIFRPGREPEPDTVRLRVERYWRPWHQRLERVLAAPGLRGLIDCHSLDGTGPAEAPDPGQRRADLTLGNNGGPGGEPDPAKEGRLACPPAALQALGRALERRGLAVAYNRPYSGGYIAQHYGPRLMARGTFAVQIEINKDLVAEAGYTRVRPERARELRRMVAEALREFAAGL